jgi:hypothetical protein
MKFLKYRNLLQKISLVILLNSLLVLNCNAGSHAKSADIVLPGKGDRVFVKAEFLGHESRSSIKLLARMGHLSQFNDYFRYSINLYRITYRTTYKGNPVIASGLISFPVTRQDSMPLMVIGGGLVYANKNVNPPSDFRLPRNYTGFEFVSSAGYFTMIPDMIGFGVSSGNVFPIQNFEHSANTMIDLMVASKEFIRDMDLRAGCKTFMLGYSQGGYVVMSALKMLEKKPVSGINITAAAVGAGGYSLNNLIAKALVNDTYKVPAYLILLFSSYNVMSDWGLTNEDIFNQPYAGEIHNLLGGKYNIGEINHQLPGEFSELFNNDFLSRLKCKSDTAIVNSFARNCVDDWVPDYHLLMGHSIYDENIPYTDSKETYDKMVEGGARNIDFVTLETRGHVSSAYTFVKDALEYFDGIQSGRIKL